MLQIDLQWNGLLSFFAELSLFDAKKDSLSEHNTVWAHQASPGFSELISIKTQLAENKKTNAHYPVVNWGISNYLV